MTNQPTVITSDTVEAHNRLSGSSPSRSDSDEDADAPFKDYRHYDEPALSMYDAHMPHGIGDDDDSFEKLYSAKPKRYDQ